MQANNEQQNRRRWLSSGVVAAAALLAFGADQFDMLSAVRTTLHDLLSPGRMIVLAMESQSELTDSVPEDATASNPSAAAATEALRSSELQRRQLIIDNARLRNELKSVRTSQSAAEVNGLSPRPLVGFDSVSAVVISRSGLPARLRELIIDAGREAKVTRAELVVEGTGFLIDRGKDHQVTAGSRVLDGAVVVGRVSQVARWVSLVEPVDSPDFSASVQLLRRTAQGVHFGAEGILTGTGTGSCVVNGIPYTEAVSAGDEVVSADIQGIQGPRLYFGRVTSAEFLAGGEWSVIVTPAMDPLSLHTVSVVQPAMDAASQDAEPVIGRTP